MTTNETKLYTRLELAAIFQVTDQTIYNWEREGILRSIKIGRKVRFTQDEVDRVIRELSNDNGTNDEKPVQI